MNPVASSTDPRLPSRLLQIGFGSTVTMGRVVAILNPGSAPLKRLMKEAAANGRLVDATQGRRTRCIIVMDSGHVVLSAIQAATISQRFESGERLTRAGVPVGE